MDREAIDFVIIWVDGNDAEWRRQKAEYAGEPFFGNEEVRFRDWDNLQYWFRGVEKYAPWVNKIHFVTWGHLPEWLNTKHPKLNIVNHRDYIPERYLPTFNSHTIELNLHRIKGLSEQFVYFNDDMFITDRVNKEDFFVKGRPCDTFAMNCIYFGQDSAGHFNGSNMEIINTEFKNKRAIMKRDFFKWYNPKNGFRNTVRTTLLLPWPWFPGFYYNHLPSSFLKSTFESVWDKYYDALDRTSADRFRRESNVNQWLFKFWQLCDGNYEVKSDKNGMCFHVKDSNFKNLCDAVLTQRYKLICVNDTQKTVDFEDKKQGLIECFEKILPQKSEFEI